MPAKNAIQGNMSKKLVREVATALGIAQTRLSYRFRNADWALDAFSIVQQTFVEYLHLSKHARKKFYFRVADTFMEGNEK